MESRCELEVTGVVDFSDQDCDHRINEKGVLIECYFLMVTAWRRWCWRWWRSSDICWLGRKFPPEILRRLFVLQICWWLQREDGDVEDDEDHRRSSWQWGWCAMVVVVMMKITGDRLEKWGSGMTIQIITFGGMTSMPLCVYVSL